MDFLQDRHWLLPHPSYRKHDTTNDGRQAGWAPEMVRASAERCRRAANDSFPLHRSFVRQTRVTAPSLRRRSGAELTRPLSVSVSPVTDAERPYCGLASGGSTGPHNSMVQASRGSDHRTACSEDLKRESPSSPADSGQRLT